MLDDSHSSTTFAKSPEDVVRWDRQEPGSESTPDDVFYRAAERPHALDTTGADRRRPLTLAGLIAAAVLSGALTAYIGIYGLPRNEPAHAAPISDASHARFGPLRP